MFEYTHRGVRKDNKLMVHGGHASTPDLPFSDSKHYIIEFIGFESGEAIFEWHEVIPETIGRFTGHLVNTINLYENDILRNTKSDDYEDETEYLVCVFIKEWAMFGMLTIDEYNKYTKEGADSLDEFMFWTFPIEDRDNEQRRICGNIYQNPELLQSL